jgi:hypothetical protein
MQTVMQQQQPTGIRKTQYRDEDLERLRPWLAWIPIENIRKTVENTTQIAKAVSNYPMMRHLASRFKLLNLDRHDIFQIQGSWFNTMRPGLLWSFLPPYGRVRDGKQESIP